MDIDKLEVSYLVLFLITGIIIIIQFELLLDLYIVIYLLLIINVILFIIIIRERHLYGIG